MCSDNVFFDVSDLNFSLANSGVTLTSTGSGGNSSECVAEPVPVTRRSGSLNIFFLLSFILIVSGLRRYTQRS